MRKKIILILLTVLLCLPVSAMYAAESETEYSENLIPKMTSWDSPSGVASSNSEWSYSYRSFDGDHSTVTSAWGSDSVASWLRYDFPKSEVISKYVMYPQQTAPARAPKNWTFEGSNDGQNWDVLDSRSNISVWFDNQAKEFEFKNSNSYTSYRINISANNGDTYTSFSELEMMSKKGSVPTPEPQPQGNRAILVVTMTTGLEKEFDLSMEEVNNFIDWYEGKQAGNGKATYAIDKHENNKGPFKNRKDYVLFNRVLTFEVSEYEN